MTQLIEVVLHELRRHKALADSALAELDETMWFHRPGSQVNSIAIIVKHLAGNLQSRWTDFLTTDGEKPNRNRDGEFELAEGDTRTSLLEKWEQGWNVVLETVGTLGTADLDKTVTIRGEPHTVVQALLRGLDHAAYHVGQITYIVRLLRPDAPWLTIAPKQKDEG